MKLKNLKRFASAALAGAMALSLAVPAFAADPATNITGTYKAITLKVTVPSTGGVQINPYGLPVTLGEGATISGEQITTSTPLLMKNQSEVDLKVTPKVGITKAGTGLTFLAADEDLSAETTKKIYVQLEMFKAPDVDDNTDTEAQKVDFAKLKTDEADFTYPILHNAATPNALVEATGGDIVLRQGKEGETQKGGAAYYRLAGSVAKKAEWTTTDGFTATVAFTFEPDEYATAVELDIDNATVEDGTAYGGTTAVVSIDVPTGKTVTASDVSVQITGTGTKPTVSVDPAVASGKITFTVNGNGADVGTYTIIVKFTDSEGTLYKGTTTLEVTAG